LAAAAIAQGGLSSIQSSFLGIVIVGYIIMGLGIFRLVPNNKKLNVISVIVLVTAGILTLPVIAVISSINQTFAVATISPKPTTLTLGGHSSEGNVGSELVYLASLVRLNVYLLCLR
jgi:predicted acyltransferase